MQQSLRPFKRVRINIKLWQPQIWSYELVKSALFHEFGSGGWIHGAISPEHNKLWTWDLHHWILQRLKFERVCRNTVTTLSDLELWTREVSHISWIWFGWVNSWCYISWTYNSDSGCSKFLLKSAGPSHHQTSVSRHQKKAFGELYSTVMVGSCELKLYRIYSHFQFFPYKFQLNENTKALGVCWSNLHNGFCVKRTHWDTGSQFVVHSWSQSREWALSKCSSFQNCYL